MAKSTWRVQAAIRPVANASHAVSNRPLPRRAHVRNVKPDSRLPWMSVELGAPIHVRAALKHHQLLPARVVCSAESCLTLLLKSVRVGACSDALAAHADLLEPPVHTAMYAPRAHAVTVASQTYATVGRRRAVLVAVELESNSTRWRPVSHPATPCHN